MLVSAFTSTPARASLKRRALSMGMDLMPVVSGLEAGAAAYAGHLPGVAVGAGSLLLQTVLKQFAENTPALVTVGSILNSWSTILLLIRLATFFPDNRYTSFPANIAHPAGCTRVAPTSSNSGLPVPRYTKSTPDEIQKVVRDWISSQPRTRIITEDKAERYIHAQPLSLLMGFPDNLGVKVVPGKEGTEVWIQGELRLGQGDLGVNRKRVKTLIRHLEANCN